LSVERREDAVCLRAYMDIFWVLMLISLAAVPLALSLCKVKLGGAVHVGH
jgi:DHA2 family multidrug resistance protein